MNEWMDRWKQRKQDQSICLSSHTVGDLSGDKKCVSATVQAAQRFRHVLKGWGAAMLPSWSRDGRVTNSRGRELTSAVTSVMWAALVVWIINSWLLYGWTGAPEPWLLHQHYRSCQTGGRGRGTGGQSGTSAHPSGLTFELEEEEGEVSWLDVDLLRPITSFLGGSGSKRSAFWFPSQQIKVPDLTGRYVWSSGDMHAVDRSLKPPLEAACALNIPAPCK